MPNKINIEEFILKANKIHKDKYDYSKSIYKGSEYKINIICPIHGEFKQIAGNHLRGNGCKKCGIKNATKAIKYNNKKFIEKANKIHNNKYDYSKVDYKDIKSKIIIICPKHGEFLQIPANHIRGCGCRGCIKLPLKNFIKRSSKIHNNKYDYSKVDYKNIKSKIIIICPKHGEFLQRLTDHYSGHGCPYCKGEKCAERRSLNFNIFNERSKKMHNNKYDYSKVDYRDTQSKVIIICPKHGEFTQTPNNHMYGYGCFKCSKTYSKKCSKWIDSFNNKNIIKGKRIMIKNRRFEFDGFDPITNTIYEFYGDLFHGNPNIFKPEDKIYYGETYGNLYNKTMEREIFLKKFGFKLIVIWEEEFDKRNIL